MFKKLLLSAVCLFFTFSSSFADFTPCKFNFGTDWDYVNNNKSTSATQSVDYITIWLNDPAFNNFWHGDMSRFCKDNNKTPVFYAYIIAKASGLGDADVGGGLATKGAEWLKGNFATVKSRYESYASGIASSYGTSKPCIWLMEPDYYQYFSGNQTVKLSFSDAANYMDEMIAIVKKHLPNAMISLDISPWNNDQQTWLSAFDLSKFSFMHTSGGRTEAGNTRIRMDGWNDVTWSQVSRISGKPIIADDGYGVGGGSTGHDATWDDVNNLKARIADGVTAITQKSPNSSWGSTINSLKTSLANENVKCSGGNSTSYTLTVTSTGGTVSKNPNQTSYSSGASVTLTATPNTGYVFKNWSGDASGTSSTVTVKMDGNKNVTAVFEQIPSNEFVLTVNIVGSGTVTQNPQKATYTGGTQVTLTANPVAGKSVFSGWSGGGVSGSNQTATLTINSNITVTATFTDTAKADSIKIEAENFTSKNGANLVVENQNGYSNIGYIENGYSTTYQVNVTKAGSYTFDFRVATGLDNAAFSVSVDGSDKGSISFPNTGSWQTYVMKSLASEVQLTAGNHTVQLNFQGAMNVDYFVLKAKTLSPISVMKRSVANTSAVRVMTSATGFKALLPSNHGYKSYSLVNLYGRTLRSGILSSSARELTFDNLTKEVMFLMLEGVNGTNILKATIVK